MNYFIVRYTLSEDLPNTWIAHILTIDLVTQGKEGDSSMDSARASAREALSLWLQDNQIIPAQAESDDGVDNTFLAPLRPAPTEDWPIDVVHFSDATIEKPITAIEIIAAP